MKLTEKRPAGRDWREVPCSAALRAQAVCASAWVSGPIRVLSELADAQSPVDPRSSTLQWHISITTNGKRPKPHHLRRALRAFGMVGAEEDNHYPGNARYFWLAVDPTHRVRCECKESESTVVEPDGYRWQNPKDAAECRGCEYEAQFGRPCPVHSAERQRLEALYESLPLVATHGPGPVVVDPCDVGDDPWDLQSKGRDP